MIGMRPNLAKEDKVSKNERICELNKALASVGSESRIDTAKVETCSTKPSKLVWWMYVRDWAGLEGLGKP
jgi:hypothetical protein